MISWRAVSSPRSRSSRSTSAGICTGVVMTRFLPGRSRRDGGEGGRGRRGGAVRDGAVGDGGVRDGAVRDGGIAVVRGGVRAAGGAARLGGVSGSRSCRPRGGPARTRPTGPELGVGVGVGVGSWGRGWRARPSKGSGYWPDAAAGCRGRGPAATPAAVPAAARARTGPAAAGPGAGLGVGRGVRVTSRGSRYWPSGPRTGRCSGHSPSASGSASCRPRRPCTTPAVVPAASVIAAAGGRGWRRTPSGSISCPFAVARVRA